MLLEELEEASTHLPYLNLKIGCRNRKVLLFVDNCAAHSKDTFSLRNARVNFFPAKTTSRLQPLNIGGSGMTKCVLFIVFLPRWSKEARARSSQSSMHKDDDLAASWESVTPTTIEHGLQMRCFHGVGSTDLVPSGEDVVDCNDREMGDTRTLIGAPIS